MLNYTSCEREALVLFATTIFFQKYKIEQINKIKYKRSKQTCHILHHVPYLNQKTK